MAKYYFLALCLFFASHAQAQSTQATPPVPGCWIYGTIDSDDDGFAPIDIDWLNSVFVPGLAQYEFGYDLSGFDFEWHDLDNNPIQGTSYMAYNGQYMMATLTYNGNGPDYADDPNFPVQVPQCFVVDVITPDGDYDNDGIPNSTEDTNGNGNLMDDDMDDDWTPDYFESNPLSISNFASIRPVVAPNPASNIIGVEIGGSQKFNFLICDLTGKQILEISNTSQKTIDISAVEKGVYLVKIDLGKEQFSQKLIVQ